MHDQSSLMKLLVLTTSSVVSSTRMDRLVLLSPSTKMLPHSKQSAEGPDPMAVCSPRSWRWVLMFLYLALVNTIPLPDPATASLSPWKFL
jgi:hypothetical protein